MKLTGIRKEDAKNSGMMKPRAGMLVASIVSNFTLTTVIGFAGGRRCSRARDRQPRHNRGGNRIDGMKV